MNNPSFLHKRSRPNFEKIPPLRISSFESLPHTPFLPSFYPTYSHIPPVYQITNFNPSLPHISMGFNSNNYPFTPRVRYLNYSQHLGLNSTVTGKEIRGNHYYLKKSPPEKKKREIQIASIPKEIVPSKRRYRKKGGYALSALQGEFYEKRVMGTQSARIRDFWKKKTNTYPFTFKQTKVFKRKNREGITVILERHRYDFKRVTPNLIEKSKKSNISS
jgi:hypothetical protein